MAYGPPVSEVASDPPNGEPARTEPTDSEPTSSLARIVVAAVDIMRATHGVLALLDDQGQVEEFVLVAHDGAERVVTELLGRTAASLGGLRDLLRAEQPVRLDEPPAFGVPGLPTALAEARALLAVPVRVRGTVVGALVVLDRVDGRPFDDENLRLLLPLASAVTASVENSLLYAEMRRRERWLEASNEVTTFVLSGAPARDVLELIAHRVAERTPADGVAILLMEADGRMVVEFATGEASELFSGMVADDSWAWSTAAIGTGRPVIIPDLGASRRSEHPAFRRLGACMLLPMRAADQTLGAIAVANYRDGRRFEPMDLAMAEAFAGQTALAAVLSEARSERERLVVFEERDRIARDLHDLVIQRLFATGMMLQGAGRTTPLPPDAEERVTRAVDELDATVREIRQTIFALNQPLDGEMVSSLRGRILREVAGAVPALGFQPHLRIEGAVDSLVPDDLANQLVAATREALSNVARHAHATAVDVDMAVRGDEVVLEVVDDGVGVGEGGRRSGLRNLQARATAAGGWCATWPSKPDGTGTRLTFQAPIR